MSNLGLFLGPLVVGAVADVAGLDVSAFVLGGILLAGVAWIALVIGETGRRPQTRPLTRRVRPGRRSGDERRRGVNEASS